MTGAPTRGVKIGRKVGVARGAIRGKLRGIGRARGKIRGKIRGNAMGAGRESGREIGRLAGFEAGFTTGDFGFCIGVGIVRGFVAEVRVGIGGEMGRTRGTGNPLDGGVGSFTGGRCRG